MPEASMQRVITFHYTMSDDAGNIVYSSEGKEPLAYLEGAGQVFPQLEEIIRDMKVGDKQRVNLNADEAFGPYDDEQVFEVPREELPNQEINVGDVFQSSDPESPPLTVVEITDTHVTMDANHPLAGRDLVFDVELIDARDATPEEISHGHAHGAGGHHH
jgi:FKBP-type peptidyl-prolyl cis-trans isomerase SlyD